jgi:hypothetical protein
MTADLELKHKNVTKARSIIEKARLRNPQNADLWRKAILIEWEHGSKDQVSSLFHFCFLSLLIFGRLSFSFCILLILSFSFLLSILFTFKVKIRKLDIQ